jgi:deoxyribodipyrimidine photolyase-related protein
MRNLVLIFGDQLSRSLPSLNACAMGDTVVLMAEVQEEATYAAHHKKKIAFVFSAMRHFARELKADGWRVDYVKLDDRSNSGSFTGEVKRALARHQPERLFVTEPGEWPVSQMVRGWAAEFAMPVEILRDSRFLASHEDFERWAADRKQLRMEFFYREMRRATGLLMDGAELEGGRWNFDAENRKPAGRALRMPEAPMFEPDQITREVKNRFGNHFGDLEPLWFAVTRGDAERAFAHFLDQALPHFGDYQDAMLAREKFLYHSVRVALPQYRLPRPARHVPPRRSGISRGPRPSQCRGRLHPPDHRLARICPRHLLAENAGLRQA